MSGSGPGIRTIDLHLASASEPSDWHLKRKLMGLAGAGAFHVLVLAAALWSPVGQLTTLGKMAPGATWITLAPVATGVTAQHEDDEPALLSDRPVSAEKLTTAVVEQNADTLPLPEASPLLPEPVDDKSLASPGLPSSGTFTTASLGEGGSNDPYAGAAPPLRVVPVKPSPRIGGDAGGSLYKVPLRADAVASVTNLLEQILAESSIGAGVLPVKVRLRVHVAPDGVVVATQILDSHPAAIEVPAFAAILNGRPLFQALPSRQDAHWQSLHLSLCRSECSDNLCDELGILGSIRVRLIASQTGNESPACDGAPVKEKESL